MDVELINLSVLILFSLTALIQFIYYLFIFSRFIIYKPVHKTRGQEPVSIVICAKNEAENLKKYLPFILEQKYSNYEVVVVNDCSEDETEEVLKLFSQKYEHLRYTVIKKDEKFSHGKKLALTVGIKSAKYEWLLLTDADCCPQSNTWLGSMAKHFSKRTSIVLGYGGYIQNSTLLNKLIRFDSAIIALQYFSFTLIGKPYMGVGRNLAYRKSIFFSNKGFASHIGIDSGDDDLFINEVANAQNIDIEPFVNAHTRTEAKRTFKNWANQKSRHFSTFTLYKKNDKIILGGEILSRVLFYFSFVCLLLLKEYWIITVIIFLGRLICQSIVFKKTFNRLNERNLFLISPLLDMILPFINMGIYLSNIIRPKRQWR